MFVKRIFTIIVVIFIVMTCVPVSVFAVDPVSTATMANALAQAITAYGASHGVSMTFDVATTDGIGQGMHELWDDFKQYVNDNNVPTYDSLANTMWATIYTKIGNYIGININDTEIPFIDAFWNWLLSGPAEMTRVDNQYYEWTVNSQTNQVDSVSVLSIPFLSIGPYTIPSAYNYGNSTVYITNYPGKSDIKADNAYIYGYLNGDYVYFIQIVYDYTHSDVAYMFKYGRDGSGILVSNGVPTGNRWNCRSNIAYWDYDANKLRVSSNDIPQPVYNISPSSMLSQYGSSIAIDGNYVSVRPYVGDTVPQDVYIPDNEDVNYAPLPYVGGIDIPWDDSLFGDGTGTLTDTQSEAISGVIDNSITDSLEKTLTLADTDNPDMSAPNEVYIPFLPVSLPSFNFSLSGIWHYVREWLSSLGAWFTMVLTIWSNLPYAIVVPVYATMVILIVLGVYKRFFM